MWKKWLTQPWFWLLLILVGIEFVYPGLQSHRLPADAYAEFLVWHERARHLPILAISLLSLALGLFFFIRGLVALFRDRATVSWNLAQATCCVFLAIIGGSLLPGFGSATEEARRINCKGNIKQIHIVLMTYAQDFDGFLPPDLQTLYDNDYLIDKGVYRCPSLVSPAEGLSDYLYFGGGRKLTRPPFLLLRDRHGNHPGMYMNSLESNGNIRNDYQKYSPSAKPGK